MKRHEAFEKEYMGAEHVSEGEVNKTITALEAGVMVGPPGEQDKRNVLHFEDGTKMVLNVTNWNNAEEATGEDDSDNWVGKSVTLFEGEAHNPSTNAPGPALRIRRKAPANIPF